MGVRLTQAADIARTAVKGTSYQVIEVPGWQNRGHGDFRVLEGIVGHHTGTSEAAAGDYPSLRIVRDGRSDLPGPLCNFGLGRSGNIYVNAAGVAWHAGASAACGFTDLNDEFAGVEAESAGGGRWTPQQLDSYPRLIGAFLAYIRRTTERYVSHRGCALPGGRKPDPTGIDDGWMRNQAGIWMRGGAAPTPAPVPPPPVVAGGGVDPNSLPSCSYGMRDNAGVRSLQGFLNWCNWSPALPLIKPVTGNYLDQTASVVAAALAQCGVRSDGRGVYTEAKIAFAKRGWDGKP